MCSSASTEEGTKTDCACYCGQDVDILRSVQICDTRGVVTRRPTTGLIIFVELIKIMRIGAT